jgi:uncharacterized protein (DUF427 family)
VNVEDRSMKATVDGKVVAESTDIVERDGYQYFPPGAVRMEWLEKVPKTAKDLECPHGVQFYDVVVGGNRHDRAAWIYESPKPKMADVGGRVGFWQDVEVA